MLEDVAAGQDSCKEGAEQQSKGEINPILDMEPKEGDRESSEKEVRSLVDSLLEERLGEDYTQLVTRYLVDPSVKRNYMPVVHAARESLRLV